MICFGVDVGGTGCKCAAFSEEGEQLAVTFEEYPLPPGTVDLPTEVLIGSVFRVIRGCADKIGNKNEIAALAVSSFGESFAAVGKDGKAVGDIRMYFGNTGNGAFDRLVEKVGAEKIMRICRVLPDSSYSLAGMLETLRTAGKPVWKFLFIAGYVCYRLSGKAATDVSLACRSLLYDVEKGEWSKELTAAAGISPELLPEVIGAGTPLGPVLPELAPILGLPGTVQVVIGSHDQIVNALGAGVCDPGDAVDTSGTCECLTPLYEKIPASLAFQKNNFACVPYLKTGGFVTYAYNISAGSVIRWYRDAIAYHLGGDGKSVYDVLNETAPEEPTSLIVLPFLQGMGGTPDVDPEATGTVFGLTTKTRIPELYRAILEGITFEMRYNMEKLAENGIRPERLLVCGGGARSPVWLQIKADILGCGIVPVCAEETGAMGSAILAFAAVTGKSPFAIAPRFRKYGEAIRPDPGRREIYHKRYELYKRLRAIYKEISSC